MEAVAALALPSPETTKMSSHIFHVLVYPAIFYLPLVIVPRMIGAELVGKIPKWEDALFINIGVIFTLGTSLLAEVARYKYREQEGCIGKRSGLKQLMVGAIGAVITNGALYSTLLQKEKK